MSLYRKYRPQQFSDLIGQEHVVTTLLNALNKKQTGHSYLFSGPRGVGKTTVARLLAKALNCQGTGKNVPCGACQSCQTVALGRSVDIIEIDAASNRGIDEIRELRDKVRFAPTVGKYKTYIIDEVHMLTKEAFNALLKTLEEPPEHAVFIMATTESHKLPATIISRCQRFEFKRATLKTVMTLLGKVTTDESIMADKEALALIARAADGSYRDSLTLLEQLSNTNDNKITVDDVRTKLGLIADPLMWQLIGQTLSGDIENCLKTFHRLNDQGVDWKYATNSLLSKLRQLLFYKISPEIVAEDISPEDEIRLKKLIDVVPEVRVVKLINSVIGAELAMRHASMPDLPLGSALIEYMSNYGVVVDRPQSAGESKKDETVKPQATITKTPDPVVVEPKPEVNVKPDSIQSIDDFSTEQKQRFIDSISAKNAALAGLIKKARISIVAGDIIFEVPYPLWADKIKETKNKTMIEAEIKTIIGQNMMVVAKSNAELKSGIAKDSEDGDKGLLSDVKDVFGE